LRTGSFYDIVDVVEGACKLKNALIKDKRTEGLYLLPAAQTRDKTAVSNEQMTKLVAELKEDFEYVLIDCRRESSTASETLSSRPIRRSWSRFPRFRPSATRTESSVCF
jgi:MinD-like ATPase involved in chromosome partitioning or flagellar assembly